MIRGASIAGRGTDHRMNNMAGRGRDILYKGGGSREGAVVGCLLLKKHNSSKVPVASSV